MLTLILSSIMLAGLAVHVCYVFQGAGLAGCVTQPFPDEADAGVPADPGWLFHVTAFSSHDAPAR